MARTVGLWTSMAAEPEGSPRRRRPVAHRGALGGAGRVGRPASRSRPHRPGARSDGRRQLATGFRCDQLSPADRCTPGTGTGAGDSIQGPGRELAAGSGCGARLRPGEVGSRKDLRIMTRKSTHGMAQFSILIAFLSAWLAVRVFAEEWPQFRGPNGSGISSSADVPVEFGPDSHVAWK